MLKERIRKWLDIEPEPTKKFELEKELKEEVARLKTDLSFWHRTFRAFSVIPCAYCKKQMRVYPYGGAYYHIKNNRKVHAECYDEYLKKNNNGSEEV